MIQKFDVPPKMGMSCTVRLDRCKDVNHRCTPITDEKTCHVEFPYPLFLFLYSPFFFLVPPR